MRKICIIGAGIVGCTTAYSLHQAGYDVTLTDAHDTAGQDATASNATQLSYATIAPYTDFENMIKHARYVFASNPHTDPVYVRQNLSIDLLRFYAQSIFTSFPSKYERRRRELFDLALGSKELINRLRHEHPDINFGLKDTGKIRIYQNRHNFNKECRAIERINRLHNTGAEELTPQQVYAREPALNYKEQFIVGGIYSPDDQSGDSAALCRGIVAYLSKSDRFTFIGGITVDDFKIQNDCILGIQTQGAHAPMIVSDEFVLTAGAGSRFLAKKLGFALPVIPVKGYTYTLPHAPFETQSCISDYDSGMAYNSYSGLLRFSGIMDFEGYEHQINPDRAAYFKRAILKVFPNLKTDMQNADLKVGLRPVLGQSVPLIGRRKYQNLWLNTGHGMYGWTLAFGSAARLTQMIKDLAGK